MIPIARPCIGERERAAVDRVLSTGSLTQGKEVALFEAEFADWVDGRTCVAVSSGTDALLLGLVAAGIGRGDEVIVPSFTFAATANAVRLAGAEPVFADIDLETYCLDPVAVAAAVTARTAAIMPVHLYGHPAAMPELCDIAAGHGLLVIEDAAQAHGARIKDRPAGAWGAVAAFSFYPTKNMTTGEGGMIVTDDPAVARRARLLRNQGMERAYENEVVGYNARMTDFAAAIGRVQLERLPGFNEARRAHAARYDAGLQGRRTPSVARDAVHVYHQYTIRCDRQVALVDGLAARGVEARVYYPVPVHRLPAYDLGIDLPLTAQAAREVVSLPVGPHLADDDVDRVISAATEVLSG